MIACAAILQLGAGRVAKGMTYIQFSAVCGGRCYSSYTHIADVYVVVYDINIPAYNKKEDCSGFYFLFKKKSPTPLFLYYSNS